MSEYEFDLADHTFRASKLAPKPAWHVVRRLAPLIGSFKDLLPSLSGASLSDVDAIVAIAAPLSEALAQMPDADADYVIDTCLAAVRLKVDNDRGWAPIMAGGGLMYDWITMPIMIQIVWRVLSHNLADFFPGKASAS